VPEVGERICYSSLTDGYQPVADFPRREDTPWTHGGPPTGYEPAPPDDDDATDGAGEEWS
jgi:hypothetical protein